jgi:hypothetical protein
MSMPLETSKLQQTLKGWRIFQKWGSNKTFVGVVSAQDPGSAVEIAAKRYQITDPEHQRRLVAELRNED